MARRTVPPPSNIYEYKGSKYKKGRVINGKTLLLRHSSLYGWVNSTLSYRDIELDAQRELLIK